MSLLDNGLVNLAAIVGTIILLCGTIPVILLLGSRGKPSGKQRS
jgi:hypothetical protein